MGFLQRSFLSIKRHEFKSMILFTLIFLLGVVLAGSILIKNTMHRIEENIVIQLPAVSSLHYTQFIYDENEWLANSPSQEVISTIGNLPYVRVYDHLVRSDVFSQDLLWALPETIDWTNLPGDLDLSSVESLVFNVRQFGTYTEQFLTLGVSNPNVADFETGLLSLVDGRRFTQAEIDNDVQVAVISQSFAKTNNLIIGSRLSLENNVYDMAALAEAGYFVAANWHLEEFMLTRRDLEFEVIGIYEVARDFVYDPQAASTFSLDSLLHMEGLLHNYIIMPIGVAIDIKMFGLEERLDNQEAVREKFGNAADARELPRIEALFLLDDPRALAAFSEAASDLLPTGWEVRDLRGSNPNIMSAMDSILQLSEWVMLGTAFASVVVLSLLIVLYLRDRQNEIGIYLALGERKIKIFFQFVAEVLVVWILAISAALILSLSLSSMLSASILETTLTSQLEDPERAHVPFEFAAFNPSELSLEELRELHDTSLSLDGTLTILAVGLATTFIATSLPLFYALGAPAKNILEVAT